MAGARPSPGVPAARFRTTLQGAGKTATGIVVPADLVAGLGHGKRPPVRVTIGAHTYRSTVAVMGGQFMIGVSADNRAKAGVQAGRHARRPTRARHRAPHGHRAQRLRHGARGRTGGQAVLRRALLQPAAMARPVHRRRQDRGHPSPSHRQVHRAAPRPQGAVTRHAVATGQDNCAEGRRNLPVRRGSRRRTRTPHDR